MYISYSSPTHKRNTKLTFNMYYCKQIIFFLYHPIRKFQISKNFFLNWTCQMSNVAGRFHRKPTIELQKFCFAYHYLTINNTKWLLGYQITVKRRIMILNLFIVLYEIIKILNHKSRILKSWKRGCNESFEIISHKFFWYDVIVLCMFKEKNRIV